MTVWVSSSYWGGWIADAGAYTGPWDGVAAPTTAMFGAGVTELDYVVTTPNPVTWSEPADNTYDCYGVDAYNTPGGGGVWGSFAEGSAVYDSTTAPPSAHLYVVLYRTGSAPTYNVDDLVPVGYTATSTGAGPGASGHWSAWQVYGVRTVAVSPTDSLLQFGRVSLTATSSGDFDTAAVGEAEREQIVGYPTPGTYTPVTTFDHGDNNSFTMNMNLQRFKGVHLSPETTMTVALDQFSTTYEGSLANPGLDSFPPLLSTLVAGVDYDVIPGTSDYVQYESTTVTFDGYEDQLGAPWGTFVTAEHQVDDASGHVVSNTPIPVPNVTVRFYDVPLTTIPDWYTPAPGTLFDTHTFSGFVPGAQTGTVDLAFSAITDEDVTIVCQFDHQNEVTLPAPFDADITMPASDSILETLTVPVQFATSGAPTAGWGPLTGRWALPRFRYWIPDVGIRWHTVGGHFATPGGVTPKILTPGQGWVDVVDGPAA